MKKSLFVGPAVATATLAFAAAAGAQTAAPAPAPEPVFPLTANIAVTTKYKFRGQDQGNTRWFSPALQGGFDWTKDGFYLGNWNSNVNFSNAAIEMDFYGGYRGEIIKDGLGFDVGVLYYLYPQQNRVIDFDTLEVYGALTWQWLTLKYSHTVSNDYFGIGEIKEQAGATRSRKGRNSGYIELNANFPLTGKLTLNGHVGYTRLASDLRDGNDGAGLAYPSFYDYKLGLTYDTSAFLGSGTSAAAAVVGANKRGFYGDFNKTRVILTLSKTL